MTSQAVMTSFSRPVRATLAVAALGVLAALGACDDKPQTVARTTVTLDRMSPLVEHDSAADAAAAAAPIKACGSGPIITLSTLERDSMRLFESRLDGTEARTIHRYAGKADAALDGNGSHAFGQAGYVTIVSGVTRTIADSRYMTDFAFFDGRTVVAAVQHDTIPRPWTSTIEIRDVTNDSVVTRLEGYAPRVAPGGSVLYLRQRDPSAPNDSTGDASANNVDIMRWTPSTLRVVARIKLDGDIGSSSAADLLPLSRDGYAYRLDDVNEHRYYDNRNAPFYAGAGYRIPDASGATSSREQADLTLSRDARWAAFTEHQRNALSVLIVADLTQKRRIQTRVIGSFPRIYGEHVVFTSDPSFVLAPDTSEFRRIEQYAVYAYHVPSGVTCQVGTYANPVWVEPALGVRR